MGLLKTPSTFTKNISKLSFGTALILTKKGSTKMFKLQKSALFFIVIVFCSFGISTNGYSNEGKTIMLATGEYPPYASAEMAGYGMVTEIISATMKEMGSKPEYKFYPWKRCESSVKKGKVWATFPYGYTKERAKDFLFSDVLLETSTKFFYYKKHTKKKIEWKTLSDLKPYRIGGVLGYYYEADFKKAGLSVDYAPSEILSLKKAIRGRIALVPLDEAVGWSLIKKNFPDKSADFGVIDKAHDTSGNFLMVSKDYPDSKKLLQKFNTALKTIKQNGEMEVILKKYNMSM